VGSSPRWDGPQRSGEAKLKANGEYPTSRIKGFEEKKLTGKNLIRRYHFLFETAEEVKREWKDISEDKGGP